jgi:DNA polymerase-1
MQKRLFLIDGYSFVFRAYHSLPPLSNPEGVPCGAVYGFANMLFKLKNRIEGHVDDSYVAVIFDAGKNTFRNDIYPAYKANRPPAPEDLIPQFPLVRDAAIAMNFEVIEKVGYEADDIIATYTRLAEAAGMKVTIASSDKDLMQLINDNVEMWDGLRDRVIAEKEVFEKFGVKPTQVLDVLSLMGDSADNIPGVPSIGPKTAAELVNQFGNLDDVLANAEKVPQKNRREKLIEFKEQALLSRQLAALCYDVPLEKSLEDLKIKTEHPETIYAFLQKHNFKSLLGKMKDKLGGVNINSVSFACNTPQQTSVTPYSLRGEGNDKAIGRYENGLTIELVETIINSPQELKNYLPPLVQAKALAYNFEYDVDKKKNSKTLKAISIAKSASEYCVINLNDVAEEVPQVSVGSAPQTDLFSAPAPAAKPDILGEYIKILHPYFNEPATNNIFYGLKDILHQLAKYNLKITSFDDVEVMAYLLGKLKDYLKIEGLANEYLGINLLESPAQKTCVLFNLQKILAQQIFENQLQFIYTSLEKPLVYNLFEIERAGIKLNPQNLKNLSTEFNLTIKQLESEIHAIAGVEFNIGSPKQMGEILFEKLNLPGGKKSKSGAYGTDVDVLEELAYQGNEIATKILEWRKLSKLVSTYTDALQQAINPQTGRVHTTFANTVTATGRLSSVDPNLQNIPIRNLEGRKIREAFIAEAGNKLIDIDFSQIELRLLAHMAEIPVLIAAFKSGKDIHLATAMEVFGLEESQVTPEIRRNAKTINFGIIYGQSAFGLAKQLGIGRNEAKNYIDAYFTKYPGILAYMERTKEYARAHGYVQTLFGRKIYLHGINDKNGMLRAFAERAAINAPLQGTAADIIKKAMLTISAEFEKQKLKSKIILQVHDELIIEAPENEAELAAKIAKAKMEQAANLSVPLTIDLKIGNNWGEVH